MSRSATGTPGRLSSPVLVAAVAAAVVIATVVLLSRDGEQPAPMAAVATAPVAMSSPPAPGVSPAPGAGGGGPLHGGGRGGHGRCPQSGRGRGRGGGLPAPRLRPGGHQRRGRLGGQACDRLIVGRRGPGGRRGGQAGRPAQGLSGGATLYRIGVLATRVSPANADRVRVELWHVGVISPPAAVPYEEWTTQRYELVWERDDWRVAGEASTPGPRPLPLPRGEPSGPGQLEAALAGFGPVGVAR